MADKLYGQDGAVDVERWMVVCVKDGVETIHSYMPETKQEALGVGDELVRDFVADSFKVIPRA